MTVASLSRRPRRRPRAQDDVPAWRLLEEKQEAEAERDALRRERDALLAERDRFIIERVKSRRRVYTIKQTAGELGVTERYIRGLIKEKKLKTIPLGIRRLGVRDEELERIVAEGIR